jgi:hypothetical protein
MSLNMPHALQWLAWVAGDQWPQGDEDAMWALAQDWHTAASSVKAQLSAVQDVITVAGNAYPSGEGRTAIDSALNQLLEGDGSLTVMATVLDNLGDVAESMGTEIQYMKIMIISSLSELAVEILLAWVFPPTAPAQEAAAIAATRLFMRVIYDSTLGAIEKALAKLIGSKLGNLLIRHIIVSTILGTGQDLLIQGIQEAQGHRKGIDWLQVGEVAAGAAADGALGFSPIGTFGHTAGTWAASKLEISNTGWKGFLTETGISAVSGAWAGSSGAAAAAIAGAAVYSAATGTNFGSNVESALQSPTSVIGGAAGGALAGLSKGAANFRSAGAFQGAGFGTPDFRWPTFGSRGTGTDHGTGADGSSAIPHGDIAMTTAQTTTAQNRRQITTDPSSSAQDPTANPSATVNISGGSRGEVAPTGSDNSGEDSVDRPFNPHSQPTNPVTVSTSTGRLGDLSTTAGHFDDTTTNEPVQTRTGADSSTTPTINDLGNTTDRPFPLPAETDTSTTTTSTGVGGTTSTRPFTDPSTETPPWATSKTTTDLGNTTTSRPLGPTSEQWPPAAGQARVTGPGGPISDGSAPNISAGSTLSTPPTGSGRGQSFAKVPDEQTRETPQTVTTTRSAHDESVQSDTSRQDTNQQHTQQDTNQQDTSQPSELSDDQAAQIWASMSPDENVWTSTGRDLGENSGLIDPLHQDEPDPSDDHTGSGHDWEFNQDATRWPTEWELPDTSRFFTNPSVGTYTTLNVPTQPFFENPDGSSSIGSGSGGGQSPYSGHHHPKSSPPDGKSSPPDGKSSPPDGKSSRSDGKGSSSQGNDLSSTNSDPSFQGSDPSPQGNNSPQANTAPSS